MHDSEGSLSLVGGAANTVPAHPLDVEGAVFGGETYTDSWVVSKGWTLWGGGG